MAFSLDANLLLHAVDSGNPFHERSRAFLDSIVSEAEIICLAWPTIMAFLRISTHPRIFAEPLRPAEAEANIEALLGLPQVRSIGETAGFWTTY